MIQLTMYGQQTSVYEYIKMILLQNTKKAKIDIQITEVNDWTEIVKQKIPYLPTIRVNNHINMSYYEGQNINQYVHELTTKILKEENYGAMLKMIVPTDFSDTATNALVYAHNLSKTVNGMIKLVHVYRPEVAQLDNLVVVDKEIEEVKKNQLKDFVTKVNQSWIGASKDYIPMDSEFRVGFAIDEIKNSCIEPYDENLIVVGSTGGTDNLKKLFGSVSLQLIKTSPSPVLVVPPKSTFNGIRNILYAVANIDKDIQACKTVLRFAEENQAVVHLLHVNTDNISYPKHTLLEKCKEQAPNIEIRYEEVTDKDVVTTLEDYIIDHTIDLVSMTTYDRGFFKDLFHKSVTKAMAIHTNIPLLVVHI